MSNLALWEQLKAAKSEKYKWVDLTHELSPRTPHWYGFSPLKCDLLFDYVEGTPDDKMAPMRCYQISVASQYGTHVDAPRHFWGNGRPMNEITVKELVYPLVVIDKSAECAADPDFVLKIEDIEKWEAEYGKIPEGAFVAFRSDWYKKENLDNPDENGQPHYPGWDKATIQWLELPDEDEPPFDIPEVQARKVDKVEAGIAEKKAFPKLKDGVGFPARCFAICPVD